VLTLPLFVPFAMYLGVVNSQSQASIDAHNLARQAARAYITSPSEELAAARVATVTSVFTENILRKHGILSRPDIQIFVKPSHASRLINQCRQLSRWRIP